MNNDSGVVGFTDLQRKWFLERDGHRCQFRYFNGISWVQCKNTSGLQVHHIVPRGWSSLHLPANFQLNGSMNGITLCCEHHVGKNGVHPDTFQANAKYRKGNKGAYEEMMSERKTLNKRGEPYWNTKWDWQFARICRKNTLRFIRAHPYPDNGNRGNTGRKPR